MQTIDEVAVENQPLSPENIQRKIGVEIVRSADLTSQFYHGPRHYFPITDENEAWARRVAKARR